MNPYGANTINGQTTWGGGQQIYMSSWVGAAYYDGNVFDGGAPDMSNESTNPGGKMKDGSHFGNPLRLYFRRNVVRRMGIEAILQLSGHTFMGRTLTSLVMPDADDVTEASVVVTDLPATWVTGETIVLRTPLVPGASPSNSFLTIRGFDSETNTLHVSNQGGAGTLPAGTTVNAGRTIYLDEREDPTYALIENNIVEGTIPPGGKAFDVHKGIVFQARAKIIGNLIIDYGSSIRSDIEVRTPNYPPAQGSVVEGNVIITRNGQNYPTVTTYGVYVASGHENVRDNLIVCPISYKTMGIRVEGVGARISRNTVIAEQIVRHEYRSLNRAVGIGLGAVSLLSVARENYTSGFDNGLGPAQQFTFPSFWSYEHGSYLDTVGVSWAGRINSEDP